MLKLIQPLPEFIIPLLNLYELSIITKEVPNDFVIQLRGGDLQIISNTNPRAMPLHFTLLFIYGTHGWHEDLKHTDQIKRLTTREFIAFHMNSRRTASDYLLRAGRLF